MEITPEQRRQIYFEEKSRIEHSGGSGIELLMVAAAAIIGFTGFLLLVSGKAGRTVKLEDLRKAYEGLSPEEEQ